MSLKHILVFNITPCYVLAVRKHLEDLLGDDCQSTKTTENQEEISVPFDHQCIIATARMLNINSLVNHTKLKALLYKAKSRYMSWRSRESKTVKDPLYAALSVLHAAEILVEQEKLTDLYKSILDHGFRNKLHDYRATHLPRFHPAVDVCPCNFLRSAAIIKAVQVLSKSSHVFVHPPLTDSNCLFSNTLQLPCAAVSSHSPSATTQWLFHGKKIRTKQSKRHDLDNRGDLIIREFSPDDLGRYSCMVNQANTVTHSGVSVSSDSKTPFTNRSLLRIYELFVV